MDKYELDLKKALARDELRNSWLEKQRLDALDSDYIEEIEYQNE